MGLAAVMEKMRYGVCTTNEQLKRTGTGPTAPNSMHIYMSESALKQRPKAPTLSAVMFMVRAVRKHLIVCADSLK